jgi:phosphate starvation-inducible membrane PsiE
VCAYVHRGECSYVYEFLRLYCVFKKKYENRRLPSVHSLDEDIFLSIAVTFLSIVEHKRTEKCILFSVVISILILKITNCISHQ